MYRPSPGRGSLRGTVVERDRRGGVRSGRHGGAGPPRDHVAVRAVIRHVAVPPGRRRAGPGARRARPLPRRRAATRARSCRSDGAGRGSPRTRGTPPGPPSSGRPCGPTSTSVAAAAATAMPPPRRCATTRHRPTRSTGAVTAPTASGACRPPRDLLTGRRLQRLPGGQAAPGDAVRARPDRPSRRTRSGPCGCRRGDEETRGHDPPRERVPGTAWQAGLRQSQ